ncbi:MAG TPA: efflux RND transporter periplasmic adaptor subunit [Gemmatimonadaceae bacterium]|jgi:RND family efflux transporter MFP subunit
MTHSPSSARRSRLPVAAFVAVLGILLAIGIIPRVTRTRALAAEARAASDTTLPTSVSTAVRAKSEPLDLPGTLQPLHEAVMYARSAGYVRHWYADIGAHVSAGEILATIEAPEVDQQVQEAQAQLKQATATLALAESDLDRWKSLAHDSAVSQQELDQKTAAYQASAATANAQRANLQRLTSVQGYSRVTAPFAGVVTARNVDVGALVSPGTSGAGTGGAGLFRVSQTDTMRVYVNVPQSLVPSIHVGQSASVSLSEQQGRTYTGRVARTSDALDPATRTLLVEVDVANTDHSLLSGSFVQVGLTTAGMQPAIVVPANALLVNATGTQVIVVDDHNVAHYHKVTVGRDYGATVEILSGVDEGAIVALNPSDQIRDGHQIRPVKVPAGG